MSGRNHGSLAALALLATACATSPGPVTWLPTGTETQTSAFGAWVEVLRVGGDTVGGELIAASRDTLWIFHGPRLMPARIPSSISSRVERPLWMITGGIAGQTQAAKPVLPFAIEDWTRLALWARFPQGLPRGFPLDSLKPKPTVGRGARPPAR